MIGEAREVFAALAADVSVPEPTRGWSRYNAGVAALLQDDSVNAGTLLGGLSESAGDSGGADAAAFQAIVDAVVDRRFPGGGEGGQAALLAGGLTGWAEADADLAARCLNAFVAAEFEGSQAWLENYIPLVEDHLHDLEVAAPWLAENVGEPDPTTPGEMRAAVKKLRLDTGVSARVRQRLATAADELDRAFAELREP
jgi:hypothetical protein